MGFITLNWALGMMHVSLVMTLRATEPLFTLLLSAYLLKSERVSWNMGLSLLPVIFGAALSSAESAGISSGMPMVMVRACMLGCRLPVVVVSNAPSTEHSEPRSLSDFSLLRLAAQISASLAWLFASYATVI
jgi:drug/metabolite transporter (DMT)-like permease